MTMISRGLSATAAVVAGLAVFAGTAWAGATGVWIDHTGRGAVEITECGGRLCGKIVWLKDGKNAKACSIQVLGNVAPVATGTWDNGWIYDPDAQTKYDVEIKQVSPNTLKLTGYAGIKMFGQTMTWTRAPADLARCGKATVPPAAAATAPLSPRPSGVAAASR